MKTKILVFILTILTIQTVGCLNPSSENEILIENFEIETLYKDEIVVNYREIYNGDGEAMMEAILSDDFILYEDLENTFSIILIDVPLDEELNNKEYSSARMINVMGTVKSIQNGILSQTVRYYKFKNPADLTEEVQAKMAHNIVPNFEPAHHSLRFETNGIAGQEFWFFAPAPENPDAGIHARVRTIINDEYIYVLRLIAMEEAILGPEADRFFDSFTLK